MNIFTAGKHVDIDIVNYKDGMYVNDDETKVYSATSKELDQIITNFIKINNQK